MNVITADEINHVDLKNGFCISATWETTLRKSFRDWISSEDTGSLSMIILGFIILEYKS